jgi:cold shock CspA family protein
MSQSNSNNTSLVIVAERIGGFCKWFNYLRGFGYVTRYDNRQDLYVNRSAIQRVQQNGVMPSLDEGEAVEFDVCQGKLTINLVMCVFLICVFFIS